MSNTKFTFFTIKEISTPKSGYKVILNKWWAINKDKKVAMFRKYYPQCNSNKEIAKKVSKVMSVLSGEVVFIKTAYIPLDYNEI